MDLANLIIQETYRKKTLLRGANPARSPEALRRAMIEAKRFVLDESMSEFAAELACVPFDVAALRRPEALTSIRHSAIPPFPKMFVHLDNHAFRRGLLKMNRKEDAAGNKLIDPDEDKEGIVKDIGWLIENDGDDVTITEFLTFDDDEIITLPFYYLYSLSDKGYVDGPYRGGYLDIKAPMLAHGITNLVDSRMAVVYTHPLDSFPKKMLTMVHAAGDTFPAHAMVAEFGGIMRYVMTFLATLNDTPKIATEVRPQKGFLGGGQIRKYQDYTTLTLKLPGRTTKLNLARRLIAKARKGWHEVRPHWRMLKEDLCPGHLWSERDTSGHSHCTVCAAKRVWIVLPHGRGDPTISVRTHKYLVTH